MIQRNIHVSFAGALLTRQAADIAKQMNVFSSQVLLRSGNKTVNGKSLMGLLSLDLKDGQDVTMIVDGEDEELAASTFERLILGD